MEEEMMEFAKNLKMLENIAKPLMSKEAISRYGNLKVAHPDKAVKAISFIAQAIQLRKIKETVTDEQFKGLLMEINNGTL